MNHDVHLTGHHFALRPIRLADAALVVELRANSDRARYLHPIEPDVAVQEAFLREYLSRPGDYYFVVEDPQTQAAEGLIGLYAIEIAARRAEVGRWIVRPGSLAAVESIWLIYRLAFEVLLLDEVICLTVADNRRAVSFHDSCGLLRRGTRQRDIQLAGDWVDRVEHALTRDRWPAIDEKLSRLAQCAK